MGMIIRNGIVYANGTPGEDGKSAYEQAVDGGYTGTEEQFNHDLANFPEKIAEETAAWLGENISPKTEVVIDKSLTVEGAAADAKATGEAIGDVKSAIQPVMKTIQVDNIENGTLLIGVPGNNARYARTAEFYPINKGEIITVKGKSYRINGSVYFYAEPYSSFCDGNYTVDLDLVANTTKEFIAPITGYFKIRYCPVPAATLTEEKLAELKTTTTYIHSTIAQNMLSLIPIPCVYMNIKNIDHRGYKNFPENTIPAFKGSKQHGFKYVETDVRFTAADSNNPLGVPVLLHDATINRTARNTDGTSISNTINISDITYQQALAYDFGIYKAPDFAGTKIPTFTQFLEACRLYGLIPIIEIKDGTREQINYLYDTACAYGLKDLAIWDGQAPQLLYMRDKAINATLIVIQRTFNLENLLAHKTDYNKIICGLQAAAITTEVINALIENNIDLCPWTITSVEEFNSINPYATWIIGNSVDLIGQIT